MDCSPPGSLVCGISQARILDWVAVSPSRGSSWPRNRTCVSCIAGRFFAIEPPGKSAFYRIPQVDWRNPLYLNSQKINFKFNASFLEQTMKTKSEIGITDMHSLCCVQSGSVDKRLVPGHCLSTYHQAPQPQVTGFPVSVGFLLAVTLWTIFGELEQNRHPDPHIFC